MRMIRAAYEKCRSASFHRIAFIGFSLLLSAPLQAVDSCGTLTEKQILELVPNRSVQMKGLQHSVYNAYRKSPDTPVDRRLSDGLIGGRTMELLGTFCRDLGIDAGEDTAEELIAAAGELGLLQERMPEWREQVIEEDFLTWTDSLESGVYGGSLHLDENLPEGPVRLFLLDAFAERVQSPDTSGSRDAEGGAGLFVLTEDDLVLANSGALEAVSEVAGVRFKTRRDLRVALGEALEGAEDDASRIMDGLLAKVDTIETFGLQQDFRSQLVDGVPPDLLERLALLNEGESDSRQAFIERANTLVGELDKLYRKQIADRVPIVSENADQSDVVTAPESFGVLRRQLRADGVPESILARLGASLTAGSPRVVGAVTTVWKQRISALVVPRPVYMLAPEVLEEPELHARLQAMPDEVAEAIATLTDVRFPNRHLFRKALQLSLPGSAMGTDLEDRILVLARKSKTHPAFDDLELAPINWEGTSCGCSPAGFSDGGYPDELYGLFPYWQAPQANADEDGATVEMDFSALNRIGYYGLGFNAEGDIVDELHWRERAFGESANPLARRDFADFVYEAHQYRTQVDVVIHNDDWSSWVPGQGKETSNVNARVATRLVESIAGLITPELQRLSNRVKPVITFGISPRRTLGDGVTLDFDFSAAGDDTAQWLFDNHLGETFYESLHLALNGPSDEDGEDDDPFSINLMVPASCLIVASASSTRPDGCAYFQLENLQYLLEYVDLFVVDMSEFEPQPENDDVLALDDRLERVRSGMESFEDIDVRLAVLGKLVPLIVAGPAEEDVEALSDTIAYERWNFAGLASWLLPSQETLHQVTRSTFIGDGGAGILASVEARVCGVVCPLRWYARMLLFVVGMSAALYMLASLHWFGLREVYGQMWFRMAVTAMVVLLVATFWCDPYWAQRQSLLMVFLVALVLAVWLLSQRSKELERTYP
ncbi:hypothetical protein ACUNV4_16320 [Granulosicoccus sp. 3-233]|uniref:hypothetical protein n=1 Tax=Granulosicoccus sp. 3-233 TaxID=3417969 RepID=UPI003D35959E